MNLKNVHKTKHYTLVEIMIAMAILVIMMGFLFQFLNSAQRLWSSTEGSSNTFDQAQIFLQLLENDLRSALYSNDKEYPGHSIPMGVICGTGSAPNQENILEKIFMVTPDSRAANEAGTYLVMYSVDNDEISRYLVDSAVGSDPMHFFYGLDPISSPSQAQEFLDVLADIEADTNRKQVIVDGVSEVKFQFFPYTAVYDNGSPPPVNTNEFFFTSVPHTVKISLSVYDSKAVEILTNQGFADSDQVVQDKKAETARLFSKIIFLR